MTDYISRDALLKELMLDPIGRMLMKRYNLDGFIKAQPTVKAIPIKWLTTQAENPSNSDAIRIALDYIVYTLWAKRKEE